VDVRLFLSRCELTGPCPAGQGAAFVGGLVAFLCRSLLGEGTRVWSVNMYDRIIFDIPSCHCKVTCPNLHLEKIVVQYSFFCCFFFCRDDSIWYSLILSYVWWDMIKLTCKSQWSPYRSCRIGFSYLWDDPWQNPTGEGAIRVRQVGISVLLKSSQICSLQCCSSTGHVIYGHHIWSVHTAWYSYVHIVLYYIMVYIWYSTFVYIASHVLELPADQLFIRAPGGFTQHRGTRWPERPRRNIVTFLCQIWRL
jgi:hypothetical protein